MNVLFLVALALALSVSFGPIEAPAQLGLRSLATVLGVLIVVALARVLSHWTIRRLDRDFSQRFTILGRYQLFRRLHAFLSLVIFAIVILQVRWNDVVTYELGLGAWLVLDELLGIAPYLIAEMISFWGFYDVDLAIRRLYTLQGQPPRNAWSRREYLSYQFRSQFGIWLATSMLIMVMKDLVAWLAPAIVPAGVELTTVITMLFGLLTFSVLLVSPWILRVVWQAAPMPAGPIRRMLDELGQDLGFRCSNILIWQTHGGVANAAITGVIPRLRYVLLSDALVEHLRPEEVISVYGHEVGHIKHHHLWYYFGFIAASMVFIVQLAHALQLLLVRMLGPELWNWIAPTMAYAPLEIMLLVPYVVIVFGYLSRRCERQADIYGSRAASQALLNVVGPSAALDNPYRDDLILVSPSPSNAAAAVEARSPPAVQTPTKGRPLQRSSHSLPPILPDGIRIFVNSLERVALLNGMTRGLWTWRHGSIAQRVEFLENIGRDSSLADKYDRSIRRLRWGLALGLLAGIAALSFVTPPW